MSGRPPIPILSAKGTTKAWLAWIAVVVYFFGLSWLFGFSYIDEADMLRLHAHPLVRLPDSSKQFLHGSILNIFIGWALRIRSLNATHAYYSCLTILAGVAFLGGSYFSCRTPEKWLKYVLVVLSTPILATLLRYVGKSDPLLVLGFLMMRLTQRRLLKCLGAGVMILSHKEMAVFVLVFEFIVEEGKNLTSWLCVCLSSLFAFFIHLVYLYFLSGPTSTRLDFVMTNHQLLLQSLLDRPLPAMVSLIIPLGLLVTFIGRVTSLRAYFILLSALAITTVTSDVTRVFAMIGLPLFFYLAERISQRELSIPQWATLAISPFLVSLATLGGGFACRCLWTFLWK